jgi:hypothetical protein
MESEIRSIINKSLSILPRPISLIINIKAGLQDNIIPYIQHIPRNVDKAQAEFLEICSYILKDEKFTKGKVHRQGIVGRFLDDSGNKDLYNIWYRFMCIDENYREWTEPFYTINYEQYKIENCSCLNNKYTELIVFF